jgi:hypothetical protein
MRTRWRVVTNVNHCQKERKRKCLEDVAVLVKGGKRKKNKHGYSFDDNFKEVDKLCYRCNKTESASKGRKRSVMKENFMMILLNARDKRKMSKSKTDNMNLLRKAQKNTLNAVVTATGFRTHEQEGRTEDERILQG